MADKDLIPAIPKLPPELYIAHLNEKLAIFVGAGVSRLVGCESWDVLASKLLHVCREKELINYYEEESIKKLSDNKKTITISKNLLEKSGNIKEFFRCFNKSLSYKPEISNPLYESIKKLGNLFITTNADCCFDFLFSEDQNKKDADYTNVKPELNHLYHIHGSKTCKKSLVFTAAEYLKRYTNKSFSIFLEEIFHKYVVLFIGYGLTEFELLDYIMKKSATNKNEIPNHYLLKAYNSHDRKLADCDELYYRELNVNLIPFSISENGYGQLIDVINDWEKKISDKGELNVNKLEVFDNYFQVEQFCSEDAEKILGLIDLKNNDDPLIYRLIKKCYLNPEISIYFVKRLFENGYFEEENNPAPVNKGNDLYSIRAWNILELVGICFDNALKSKKNRDICIIKKIIDKLIKFKNDNYHTSEWIINNIFKLDESMIKKTYVTYISSSLNSKFGTMIQSQALESNFTKKVLYYAKTDLIFSILDKLLIVNQKKLRVSLKLDLYYLNQLVMKSYKELQNLDSLKFITVVEKCLNSIAINTYEILTISFYYNVNNELEVDDISTVQTVVNLYLWLLKQRKDIKEYLNSREKENSTVGYICNSLNNTEFLNKDYSSSERDLEFSISDEIEIKTDIFEKKNIADVVRILKEKEKSKLDIIQEQSLIKSFHFWVINNHINIINNIKEFISLGLFWQDQIIVALNQLLSEHKSIDYKKILPFISVNINETGRIWELKEKRNSIEKKYIKNVSDFIVNVLTNINMDVQTVDEIYLIVKLIFKHRNYQIDTNPYKLGYTTDFLNSESGKINKAFFILNIIHFNLTKEYITDFMSIISNEIKKQEIDEMFFYSIGAYFNYLYVQERKWADENIKSLLKSPFFDGLLTCCTMSEELYFYLLSTGVFEFVINTCKKDYIVRIVDYSCSSYFQDFEQFSDDGCLLKQLLKNIQPYIVGTILLYVRRKNNNITSNKIKELWKCLYDAIKDISDKQDYDNSLQELLYFLDYVEIIDDEIYEYLKFSCQYIKQYKMDHYLIPRFLVLYANENNKKYIEELLMCITENEIYFYNYNDCVVSLLRKILSNNLSLAKKICDKYYMTSGLDIYSDLLKECKQREEEK